MGTYPYGLVFYGFALVDENGQAIEPWESEDVDEEVSLYTDWQERLTEKKGNAMPKHKEWSAPEWGAFWEKQRAVEEASPVKVALAGYSENLINCIVVKESYVRVEWADILPITNLEIKPEWDKQLQEWCNLLGVEYRQPGWHVACLYF